MYVYDLAYWRHELVSGFLFGLSGIAEDRIVASIATAFCYLTMPLLRSLDNPEEKLLLTLVHYYLGI